MGYGVIIRYEVMGQGRGDSETYSTGEDYVFYGIEEMETLRLIPMTSDLALNAGKPVATVESERRHRPATCRKQFGTAF